MIDIKSTFIIVFFAMQVAKSINSNNFILNNLINQLFNGTTSSRIRIIIESELFNISVNTHTALHQYFLPDIQIQLFLVTSFETTAI